VGFLTLSRMLLGECLKQYCHNFFPHMTTVVEKVTLTLGYWKLTMVNTQCDGKKNHMLAKVIAKNMPSNGVHLNYRSFAEYTRHLIPVPKG
jgi:hypothetical protein